MEFHELKQEICNHAMLHELVAEEQAGNDGVTTEQLKTTVNEGPLVAFHMLVDVAVHCHQKSWWTDPEKMIMKLSVPCCTLFTIAL